jgi:hypothetical protein
MAFDLRTNNASGFAVIDQPAGVLATQENFISQYDYSVSTRIVAQLHYQHGLGKITEFLKYNSKEDFMLLIQ